MITFAKYARAQLLDVVCPFDDAVTLDYATEDERSELLAGRTVISASEAGRFLCSSAAKPTVFVVRGLNPLEVQALQPLLGPMPDDVAAWLREHGGDVSDLPPEAQATFMAWLTQRLHVFARAGLVGLKGSVPDGWPTERESVGSLHLWPAETLAGLPGAVRTWLGSVVARLTNPVDGEKKSVSG